VDEYEIIDGEAGPNLAKDGFKEFPLERIQIQDMSDRRARLKCYTSNSARSASLTPAKEEEIFHIDHQNSRLTLQQIAGKYGLNGKARAIVVDRLNSRGEDSIQTKT